jgi:hypothetical protein
MNLLKSTITAFAMMSVVGASAQTQMALRLDKAQKDVHP